MQYKNSTSIHLHIGRTRQVTVKLKKNHFKTDKRKYVVTQHAVSLGLLTISITGSFWLG